MPETTNGIDNTTHNFLKDDSFKKPMEWSDLLSAATLAPHKLPPHFIFLEDFPHDPFETDYESIVSSASFRRLQDKTQVFPLDQSDFVRTRLTHSMEVSAIARHLGVMVTHLVKPKIEKEREQPKTPIKRFVSDESETVKQAIPTILSCAGLLHDLGNPPFGHFGEDAIRDWFKANKDREFSPYRDPAETVNICNAIGEKRYKDLCNFEGNAQAIRILSKVKYEPDGNDLNLTYALINTLMKYTEDSMHFSDDPKSDVKKHKLGYYQAEKDIIDQICTETTTKRDDGTYCRHPLTYLLEAADDIAYDTTDIEDTVKKGLLSVNGFIDYFISDLNKKEDSYKEKHPGPQDKTKGEPKKFYESHLIINNLSERMKKGSCPEEEFNAFQRWLQLLRQCLMYSVVFSFYDNYDEIINGTFEEDLFEGGYHKYTVEIIEDAVHEFAHHSPNILKLELSAKKIISSLLDDFVGAVIDWPEETDSRKPTKEHEKLQLILSASLKADYEKYVEDNNPDENERLYRRLLMVTDFISGMTDSYARNLYQELNGM